ncbi:MAG: FecR domain-containing protein [Pseudobdellovibrio sp.]
MKKNKIIRVYLIFSVLFLAVNQFTFAADNCSKADSRSTVVNKSNLATVTNVVNEVSQANPERKSLIREMANKKRTITFASGLVVTIHGNSEISISDVKRNKKNELCSVKMKLVSGKATVENKHQKLPEGCETVMNNEIQLETDNLAIRPLGTRYSVDLNNEIALLNSDNIDEDVTVEQGAVEIKIKKFKKSKSAKSKTKESRRYAATEGNAETPDYVFEDQKHTLKKGGKFKIKKTKKDRVATIKVINPED